jgi:hypothetical protein
MVSLHWSCLFANVQAWREALASAIAVRVVGAMHCVLLGCLFVRAPGLSTSREGV